MEVFLQKKRKLMVKTEYSKIPISLLEVGGSKKKCNILSGCGSGRISI